MGEISISVELRGSRGKGQARKLRAGGRIPGVVYGRGKEAVSISLDPSILERSIKASHAGLNTLIDLVGEASVTGRTVLVKELQREPVKGLLLHADFLEIDLTEKIQVSVPVRIEGEAAGSVMGGVVEHTMREIELACLPNAIPDEVTVNIESLELGDSLHVSDIALPSGVELISDPSLSLVSVALPKVIEEPEVEEAEGVEGVEGAEGAEAPEGAEPGEAPAAEPDSDSGGKN